MSNNNYIVSSWTQVESSGDQSAVQSYADSIDGNITGTGPGEITNPVLYIEPDQNSSPYLEYVVSAHNFRIGSGTNPFAENIIENPLLIGTYNEFEYNNGTNGVTLPYPIEFVRFTNTGTPNMPGNTVVCQVFFYADYVFPAEDVDLQIDIDTYTPLATWDTTQSQYRLNVLATNWIWPNNDYFWYQTYTENPSDGALTNAGLLVDDFYIKPTTDYRNPGADLENFSGNSIDAPEMYGRSAFSQAIIPGDQNTNNVSYYDNIPIDDSDGIDIIPESMEEYPDAKIFWLAEYSDNVYDQGFIPILSNGWNELEASSMQNVTQQFQGRAFIYPFNSPVTGAQPVDGYGSFMEEGFGFTWASDDVNSVGNTFVDSLTSTAAVDSGGNVYRTMKWRIRSSSNSIVLAEDFSIMSWDVRTFEVSQKYSPGLIDQETGNPCLNIASQAVPTLNMNLTQVLEQNTSNTVGQLGGYAPLLCSYEDEDGETIYHYLKESHVKGFGYHYLDGIGGTALSDFTGDENVNDISCSSCYGGLSKMSRYKYEYTSNDFASFLGVGNGSNFTESVVGNIYLYSKPKGFKNPQQVSSTYFPWYSPNWGNNVPWEPKYDVDGTGSTLAASTDAHARETGSCGAGSNVLFKWITIHDLGDINGYGNEVEITAWVCPDYTPPVLDLNETYLFQLQHRVRDNDPEGMPSNPFNGIDINSSYENDGNITITGLDVDSSGGTRRRVTTDVIENTVRGGFSDERTVYSLSGRVLKNKPTPIATIKIEASKDSNGNYTHYFQRKPYLLKKPDNINLVLKSRSSTNSYTFDLVYNENKSISGFDRTQVDIRFKQLPVITRSVDITRITTGRSIINSNGGVRDITVFGRPGATFKLLVNQVDEFLDTDGNVKHTTEKSILTPVVSNSVIVDSIGNNFAQISRTIGSTGRYSFTQKFPKVTKRTPNKIYLIADSVSGDILNLDTDTNSFGTDSAPAYVKTLTQYMDPVLTLKATVGSNYALTHVDDVAISPTPSDGDDYSKTYNGLLNARAGDLKNISAYSTSFTVKYLITRSSRSAFTVFRAPEFSEIRPFTDNNTASITDGSSDWTNTDPSVNGGTQIFISNISQVMSAHDGVSNRVCTISFEVNIEKWGTKDLTLDLDLDKILSIS